MSEQRGPAALVVDHFNPFSKTIRPALTRCGFTVFCAKSPREGLAWFRAYQSKIDVALIDVATPAAGNLDLAADLDRLRPGLPILYIVGADKTIARCSIEAHAPHSVLVTPFTAEQLVERVNGLMDTKVATLPTAEEELWERLAAASHPALSESAMLYIYELRQATLAAAHINVLRASDIHYTFRRTNYEAAPYCMIVPAADANRARTLIAKAFAGGRMVSAA